MYTKEREINYQLIRLMNSGLNLHEVNFLRRIVFAHARGRSMSENDYKTMNEVIDKLERFSNLLETRTQRKKRVIKKYSRKKGQDRIANFMTKGLGFNLNESVSFARPPELQRKVMKKRAPTRAGSSAGKIGKTRVIGFNKMNRDLDKLANSLNAMIKSFENIGKGKKGKSLARKGIKTFIDNIRTEVRIKR